MYLLVISGVKEIKGYRVVKRRKLETKKFGKVDWQKRLMMGSKLWLLPPVQGHNGRKHRNWEFSSFPTTDH